MGQERGWRFSLHSALSLHLPHLCRGTRNKYVCVYLSVYPLYNQLQITLKLHTRLVWVCLCGEWICVHVQEMYMPTPICTEARGQQLVSFPLLFSNVFLRLDLSLNLELTNLASKFQDPTVSAFQCWNCRCYLCGCWGSKLSPQACTTLITHWSLPSPNSGWFVFTHLCLSK